MEYIDIIGSILFYLGIQFLILLKQLPKIKQQHEVMLEINFNKTSNFVILHNIYFAFYPACGDVVRSERS